MNSLSLISFFGCLILVSCTTVVDLSYIPECRIRGCTSQCDVTQYLPNGLSGDIEFTSSAQSGHWCVALNRNYFLSSLTVTSSNNNHVVVYINGVTGTSGFTTSENTTVNVGNELSISGSANVGGYLGSFAAGLIFLGGNAALSTTPASFVNITDGSTLEIGAGSNIQGGLENADHGCMTFSGTTTLDGSNVVGTFVCGESAVSSTITVTAGNLDITTFFVSSQFWGASVSTFNVPQGSTVTVGTYILEPSYIAPSLHINGPGTFQVDSLAGNTGTISVNNGAQLIVTGALTGSGSLITDSTSSVVVTNNQFTGTVSGHFSTA